LNGSNTTCKVYYQSSASKLYLSSPNNFLLESFLTFPSAACVRFTYLSYSDNIPSHERVRYEFDLPIIRHKELFYILPKFSRCIARLHHNNTLVLTVARNRDYSQLQILTYDELNITDFIFDNFNIDELYIAHTALNYTEIIVPLLPFISILSLERNTQDIQDFELLSHTNIHAKAILVLNDTMTEQNILSLQTIISKNRSIKSFTVLNKTLDTQPQISAIFSSLLLTYNPIRSVTYKPLHHDEETDLICINATRVNDILRAKRIVCSLIKYPSIPHILSIDILRLLLLAL
jgi:hypothetical protein